MGRKSLARLRVEAHLENLLWIETEIAATEGRCQGRLTEEAYAYVKKHKQAEYLDPDERLDFWYEVESGLNDGSAEKLHEEAVKAAPTVYEMAREAVVTNGAQWHHNVKLVQCNRKRVYITRYNGELLLVYQELDSRSLVRKTMQVRCGFLVGFSGWQFYLPKTEYDAWVARCQGGKQVRERGARGSGFTLPENRNWRKRWK